MRNPPVGLILCAQRDAAVADYALEGLLNNVLAAEYRSTLPDEELRIAALEYKPLEAHAPTKLASNLPRFSI